jgi:hypothetical protein
LADHGARVPEVLPAAELEGFLTGLTIGAYFYCHAARTSFWCGGAAFGTYFEYEYSSVPRVPYTPANLPVPA